MAIPVIVDGSPGKALIKPVPGDPLEELKVIGAKRTHRGWEFPDARWLRLWAMDIVDAEDRTTLRDAKFPELAEKVHHPRWDDLDGYQKDLVERLVGSYQAGFGQLLVVSPGLGKTVVACVAAELLFAGPILLVCPASLRRNWARHIEAWTTGSYGPATRRPKPNTEWTIASYQEVALHPDYFVGKNKFGLIILDESVMVKSHDSQRYKAIEKVRQQSKAAVWCLSASPTTRYNDDLFTQLHLVDPPSFTSYWRFAERYCSTEENKWGPGKIVTGNRRKATPLEDSREQAYVVNQGDVLELPEYLFEVVDVDLTVKQKVAYADMLREFYAELEGEEMSAKNKGARLIRLLQIASSLGEFGLTDDAKMDTLAELIESGAYEPPYLVWFHWRETGEIIRDRMAKLGLTPGFVNGDTKDKDQVIQSFVNGEHDSLVCSIGVGKYGHNMVNVKTMVFHDKTFDADAYYQALHRTRRRGLGHSPVVVSLRAPGTADELVEKNLAGKMGSVARLTNNDLFQLLAGIGGDE